MTRGTFAVDGDIISYRVASVSDEPDECEAKIDNMLHNIVKDTGVEQMRIYITHDGKGFRHEVAKTKTYKGNRDQSKPVQLEFCRAYLMYRYKALLVHYYEADDAIASDMVQHGAFHCGIDKDLYQIAGKHYDFTKRTWQHIKEDEAKINLYRQILTGDSVDNIQGLPRVGAKTAEKTITNADTADADAKALYKEVCEKRITGVGVAEYWKEQVQLVQLVTDLDIMDLVTVQLKRNTLGI